MKTATNWILVTGATLTLTAAVAGGAFWYSCQQQSDQYDLSKLSQMPDRVALKDIPQSVVQQATAREDVNPAQALAVTEFGLSGNGFRTRVVRGMVSGLIEQKFSPGEVAEFYFNRVNPGSARLHAAIADRHAVQESNSEVTTVANTQPAPPVHDAPPEFTPLPPAEVPAVPVRRAVAVTKPEPAVPVRRAVAVSDVPVARALPVSEPVVSPYVPVRRALPVSNLALMSRPALGEVGRVPAESRPGTVFVSPETIYRVAVVEPR